MVFYGARILFHLPKNKKKILNLKTQGSGHRKFAPVLDGSKVYVKNLILDFLIIVYHPGHLCI